MSDGSNERRQNDPHMRPVKAADDLTRTEADPPPNTAISQAAQRDAADLVARNTAYIRHATEMALLSAQARADQARLDTSKPSEERRALRASLLRERKAASNATFGLIIAFVLLLIGSIAGGVYFFSTQNNTINTASAAVTPGVVTSTTSPARSSDVTAPEKTPTTIHVNPNPDGAGTSGQPEKPVNVAPSFKGAIGGSDTGDLTHIRPPLGPMNLSGDALHDDGIRPMQGVSIDTKDRGKNGR